MPYAHSQPLSAHCQRVFADMNAANVALDRELAVSRSRAEGLRRREAMLREREAQIAAAAPRRFSRIDAAEPLS